MVKLTPDQQRMLCDAEPAVFRSIKGAWGLRGATNLHLATADVATLAARPRWHGRMWLSPSRHGSNVPPHDGTAPYRVPAVALGH